MARIRTFWYSLLDSLWFTPAIITLAAAILAGLLVNVNDAVLARLEPETTWWVFGGSAEGAAGVLSAIASGIITVTGVVFSVTIVALQLASSQFTPRVLRQFTADRANQVVLGVFIGTFTYALLVQRTLRSGNGDEFVPNVAVTGALALTLISIGFLIFFINHAARSIQAAVVIETVVSDTMDVIRATFPERIADGGGTDTPFAAAEYTSGRPDAPLRIGARQGGYVQSVDARALRNIARSRQLVIRMDVDIGKHVLPGDDVMSVWPGADVDERTEAKLRDALVLGIERTAQQDLKLGVIELMDIAVKALSPSVNDPTTALNALDRLGEILLDMAWRRRGDTVELSPDGRPLLILQRPDLDDTVAIAFDQIRHYGAGNPTVAIAMVRLLGRLADLAPHARTIFARHLREVAGTAEREVRDPIDRERLDSAIREASRLAFRSRDAREPAAQRAV